MNHMRRGEKSKQTGKSGKLLDRRDGHAPRRPDCFASKSATRARGSRAHARCWPRARQGSAAASVVVDRDLGSPRARCVCCTGSRRSSGCSCASLGLRVLRRFSLSGGEAHAEGPPGILATCREDVDGGLQPDCIGSPDFFSLRSTAPRACSSHGRHAEEQVGGGHVGSVVEHLGPLLVTYTKWAFAGGASAVGPETSVTSGAQRRAAGLGGWR